MNNNNLLKKIAPGYGWAFMIVAVSLNMLSYFGLRAIYTPTSYGDWSLAIDHIIPFVPIFILPYVLAYGHWILGYIVIVRDNKYLCFRLMTAEIMAKLICLACFVVLPLRQYYRDVPEVLSLIEGNDFISWLTRLIFEADAPTNLFPSIHCLESYFVMRGAFMCKKVSTGYRVFMTVFAVLVFASTLFLKQHYFVDFVGAVAAAELCLFISKHLPFVRKTKEVE